ncbi:DUF1488 family protein [Ferrimonas lipolytica]|uniref:DUF1488 domain-containing protein n=1 Tax=Ferrimonas lipolytica TaxID=2724191 RepID=A0A6H1UH90_9GAMM|nr:DUF1488 family protein [Ferrimonas lipolytica]QIZ78188.1 DUF1488 domain-containing protein [Ferrimonas lipolytica]
MNQQILFNDLLDIKWQQGTVAFSAQWGGSSVLCLIGIDQLAKRSGQTIGNAEQAGVVFEQLRFELEEEAEILIEDEAFDAQGRIWLGHPAC